MPTIAQSLKDGVVAAVQGGLFVGCESKHRAFHQMEEVGPKVEHGDERFLHVVAVLYERHEMEVGTLLDPIDDLLSEEDVEVAGLESHRSAVDKKIAHSAFAESDEEKVAFEGLARKVDAAEIFDDQNVLAFGRCGRGIGAQIVQLYFS